jgi:hypothetical protein
MSETAHPGKVNPARKPNFIRSIEQRAYEAGFHPDTLRTQIAKGEGPPVIRLSPKRWGISDNDWDEWLNSRRIAPQEESPAPRHRGSKGDALHQAALASTARQEPTDARDAPDAKVLINRPGRRPKQTHSP